MEPTQSTIRGELSASPPLSWLKDALISQRETSVRLWCLLSLRAHVLPAQIKVLVVPVSSGGPSHETGFSVVLWNAAEGSEAPPPLLPSVDP